MWRVDGQAQQVHPPPPCACPGRRFAHSLGVCHLAAKWTERLAAGLAREKGEAYAFGNIDVALASAAGAPARRTAPCVQCTLPGMPASCMQSLADTPLSSCEWVVGAGLCHDIGHGPFSHVFEYELLPRLGVNNGWWVPSVAAACLPRHRLLHELTHTTWLPRAPLGGAAHTRCCAAALPQVPRADVGPLAGVHHR